MLNQNARSNISWKPDTAYYTGQRTNHCHQLFATIRRTKPQCCWRALQEGRPTNTGLLKSRICEWGSRSHPWSRKLRCAFRAGEWDFRCLIIITSTSLENESTFITGICLDWALCCRHSLVHAHKWFLIEDFRVIRPLPNLNLNIGHCFWYQWPTLVEHYRHARSLRLFGTQWLLLFAIERNRRQVDCVCFSIFACSHDAWGKN